MCNNIDGEGVMYIHGDVPGRDWGPTRHWPVSVVVGLPSICERGQPCHEGVLVLVLVVVSSESSGGA